MVKKLSLIFPLILLAFYLLAGKSPLAEEEEPYQLDVGYVEWKNRPLKVVVEVADNRIERAIGLMFRKELPTGQGMLLQYPDEKILQIWMKEMLFPLDVIFISADGKIVSFVKNLQPCPTDPCENFSSNDKAQYALEVNAGFVDENAVTVGQDLLFFF